MREDGYSEEEEEERVADASGTESEGEGSRERQKERKEPRDTSIQRELADAIVRLAPIDELRFLLQCGANVSCKHARAGLGCLVHRPAHPHP